MGFNRKIINREYIDTKIKQNKTFDEIFDAGAIVFLDRYSSLAYELYLKKFPVEEILRELEKLD